jgi:hypothetical protein
VQQKVQRQHQPLSSIDVLSKRFLRQLQHLTGPTSVAASNFIIVDVVVILVRLVEVN